jgi:hypothetical protein
MDGERERGREEAGGGGERELSADLTLCRHREVYDKELKR